MQSSTTKDFWRLYWQIPKDMQRLAKENYRLWRENPRYPSLHFKRINAAEPLYSVRVGLHYRALGLLENDRVTWFWIGSHGEYDKLVG